MSHIGYPLLGDPLYGNTEDNSGLEYQALHCRQINLIHPITKSDLVVTAPFPQQIRDFLQKDGYSCLL